MHNVLDALRYMAEHGGSWCGGTGSGVWFPVLSNARSDSDAYVGFTKKELLDFLEHYDEVTRER